MLRTASVRLESGTVVDQFPVGAEYAFLSGHILQGVLHLIHCWDTLTGFDRPARGAIPELQAAFSVAGSWTNGSNWHRVGCGGSSAFGFFLMPREEHSAIHPTQFALLVCSPFFVLLFG